ncbi:hypothetical protein [Pseudomonas sp. 34 E 7]|nr:hypothetical protein [Pseudomonas sp. 34 E 7]
MDIVDAQGLCDHSRAAAIIAGEQVAADVLGLELLHGVQCAGLERVAKREQAQHARMCALFDQPGQGATFGFPFSRALTQRAGVKAGFFQQASIAQGQLPAVQGAGDAASGQGLAGTDVSRVQPLFVTGIQHRLGQRVLAATLQGSRLLQQARGVAVHRRQMGDSRRARGEGAGLVEHHGAHRMGMLQRLGVLDQNAMACSDAGAGHDCRRRRQAQGARAGDHQHRDRVDDCALQGRAVQPPAREGEQCHYQHRRDEDLADFIHQFLDRCLGGLGVLDQADDPGQHAFRAQGLGTHQQATFTVDRATGDPVARLFRHRQAFAADQRFVGMALAIDDFAVYREAFAGLYHDQVTELERSDGDLFLTALQHAHRPLGAQGFEGTNGAGGLALGAALQVFTQQHQCDHHGRGFEIQMRSGPGEPLINAQAVTGTGADRHQQVHIARAGAHGFPGGPVKTRTEDKLHRCRQGELHPGGEHPVQAEGFDQHRQHQGQCQHDRQHQRPAFAMQVPDLIGLGGGVSLGQAGGVAGFVDGGDQHAGVHLADYLDVGAFVGQVDAGTLHPRHLAQRTLHSAGATGAGHAADGQVKGGGSIHGAVLRKTVPPASTLTCGEGQASLNLSLIAQLGGFEVHAVRALGNPQLAHVAGLERDVLGGRGEHAGQTARRLPRQQFQAQ